MREAYEFPGLRPLTESAAAEGRVEIGPTTQRWAPLEYVNMASQTRQLVRPEDQEELASSMTDWDYTKNPPEAKITLIQPVTLGFFDQRQLGTYLENLNRTWHTNHRVEDFRSLNDKGQHYLLVIAGHRRILAIQQKAKELGLTSESIDVAANIEDGATISFHEAVCIQYRENFHKRPESWKDARAVSAILNEGLSSGRYTNFAECARDLGINAERVSRAWRFGLLPIAIQKLCEDGTMGYANTLLIGELGVGTCWYWCVKHFENDGQLHAKFIAKHKAGTLSLHDFSGLVTEDQKMELQSSMLVHAMHLSKLQVRQAMDYTREQLRALIKENESQMELTLYTEEELRKIADVEVRARIRESVINALRIMRVALTAENDRVETGKRLAVATSPLALLAIANCLKATLELQEWRTLPVDVLTKIIGEADSEAATALALLEALDQDEGTAGVLGASTNGNGHHAWPAAAAQS